MEKRDELATITRPIRTPNPPMVREYVAIIVTMAITISAYQSQTSLQYLPGCFRFSLERKCRHRRLLSSR